MLLDAVPVAGMKRRRAALLGEPPSPLSPPSGCHFHPRCPLATEQCRMQAPALRMIENRHLAACHFARGAAP